MYIDEIFTSIQGEGIYCGYRQVFVRLSGCNISCEYCDESHAEPKYLEPEDVAAEVNTLAKQWHHSVSLTGGEPLLQVDSLKRLIPLLKLPVFLETNGTLPNYFTEIKGFIDIVSLDYKDGYHTQFAEFLTLCHDMDVYVKYVVMRETSVKLIHDIAQLMASINKDVPLVLQPVTPHGKIKHAPQQNDLLKFYQAAKNCLNDVRVIPQTHKLMKIK